MKGHPFCNHVATALLQGVSQMFGTDQSYMCGAPFLGSSIVCRWYSICVVLAPAQLHAHTDTLHKHRRMVRHFTLRVSLNNRNIRSLPHVTLHILSARALRCWRACSAAILGLGCAAPCHTTCPLAPACLMQSTNPDVMHQDCKWMLWAVLQHWRGPRAIRTHGQTHHFFL